MLNVSEAVKTLFQTDGVLKNIRISFPNGEYEDICNDRLIKESLKFDESISSREIIQFGLCESSQVSFECVEIEDITGIEIAVFIEIDTIGTSISSQTATDVPFPFYRLPLGKFIVDEAKLSAKMNTRKIVAYSAFSNLPYGDWWTLMNWWAYDGPSQQQDKTLDLNVMNFIFSSNNKMFDLSDAEGTVVTGWQHLTYDTDAIELSVVITSATSGNSYQVDFTFPGSTTYFCKIENYDRYHPWGTLSKLGRLDKYKLSSSYESSVDYVIEKLRTQAGAGFDPITDEDVLDEVRRIIDIFSVFDPMSFYKTVNSGYEGSLDYNFIKSSGKRLNEGDVFMMPSYLTVFPKVWVNQNGDQLSYSATYLDSINDVVVSEIDVDYNDFTIKVAPEIIIRNELDTAGLYSFLKPILFLNMRNLLEGCVELLGKFGRMGRNGYFELISIAEVMLDSLFPSDSLYPANNLYPMEWRLRTVNSEDEEIISNNASIDLWYENEFIEFGKLICEYQNSEILDENGNPTQAVFESSWEGKGYGKRYVYDVSNNEIIKNNTYTTAEITALLAPLLGVVRKIRYYPAEVSMVGLPYIEAGDQMRIHCHGHQILVLNLSRTLNGIQVLRDKVKTD